MEILTVKNALQRLDELNVTYLQNDFYGEGNSAEDQITTNELEEIFQVLERTYATDEFLEQLSAKHDSIVWLVAFEKCTNKWQALFYDEELDEIWTDL